jgi:hypothetical protein
MPKIEGLFSGMWARWNALLDDVEALRPNAIRINGHRVPVVGQHVTRGTPFRRHRRRTTPITHIVVHESVTRTVEAMEATLRRKQYGVHCTLPPEGGIIQHNPLEHRLHHAGGLNGPAGGYEIINPYYPKDMRSGGPWTKVIDAPWAHKGQYVVPTHEQLEALVALLYATFDASARGLIAVPRSWPGLRGNRMRMGLISGEPRDQHGIHAHHYSAHADGGFPVLYAYLRMERGLNPAQAYSLAIDLATGASSWITL